MNVRNAIEVDAPAIAALHMVTLPADVSDFTPLGRRLVERLYANAVERRTATVLVAEEQGALAGFVMITPDVAALFSRSLLDGPGDVVRFLLTANPFGLLKAIVAKVRSGTVQVPSVPELVYIGVDARFRGRGVGAALIDGADAAFRGAGIQRYELNVHADNAPAVKLYAAKGFTITRRYEKSGHAMMNMLRELSPPTRPAG